MNYVATKHVVRRMRKRMGLNKSACLKVLDRVMMEGMQAHDFKGELNDYLQGIYDNASEVNSVKVFDKYVFLMADDRFVTCYIIPNEFRRSALNAQRKAKTK